jgi:hypothetical protein
LRVRVKALALFAVSLYNGFAQALFATVATIVITSFVVVLIVTVAITLVIFGCSTWICGPWRRTGFRPWTGTTTAQGLQGLLACDTESRFDKLFDEVVDIVLSDPELPRNNQKSITTSAEFHIALGT